MMSAHDSVLTYTMSRFHLFRRMTVVNVEKSNTLFLRRPILKVTTEHPPFIGFLWLRIMPKEDLDIMKKNMEYNVTTLKYFSYEDRETDYEKFKSIIKE